MPLRPSWALTSPSFIAPPCGERRLLAVVGDRDAEVAGVLERRAHQMRADHGLAVVAHGDGARAHHLAELGERSPRLADRDRADRVDAGRVGALRLTDDESDRRLVVGHRIGVRHRADRGEPAGRRGAGAGGDRLDVLAPRLAQVAVHVDEPGRHHQPGAVDRPRRSRRPRPAGGRSRRSARRGSATSADLVEPLRRIDDPPAAQQDEAAHRAAPAPLLLAASASSGRPPESR